MGLCTRREAKKNGSRRVDVQVKNTSCHNLNLRGLCSCRELTRAGVVKGDVGDWNAVACCDLRESLRVRW